MTPPYVPGRNAFHATLCSFLGLGARDLAELGGFSDRFARDLFAGRRPFPLDTQMALEQLLGDWDTITEASTQDFMAGVSTVYIYRTNEQLRASAVGRVWPARGKAAGAFVGPYRAAIFKAWLSAKSRGTAGELLFASVPEVGE